MSSWYFPSWNGDVRIESVEDDPGSTIITIIEPTVEELRVLNACAQLFKGKGWLGKRKTIWNPRGNRDFQKTTVAAPLAEIGLYMIAHLKPGVTALTAVKLTDGTVTAKGSAERGFLSWLNNFFDSADGDKEFGTTGQLAGILESAAEVDSESAKLVAQRMWERAEERRAKDSGNPKPAKEDSPHRKEAEEPKAIEKKEPEVEKAVTVRRPTPSCPRCLPGSVEAADEVLQSFLTEEQHEMWAKERAIEVTGHLSGHRYIVSHRNGRHAQRAGKICFDQDDCGVLHFHDNTVPPEEEVLATKLMLEHRENWLRHEASCLGGDFDWVFKNPFGDGGDGVKDSVFAGQIGNFMRGFLMTFEGGKFALPEDRPYVGKANVDVDKLIDKLSKSTCGNFVSYGY